MEDRFKISLLLLSLFMIAFGIFIFYVVFFIIELHKQPVYLIMTVPVLALVLVLPLYSGFNLLIEELRCLFHIPPKKKD